MAHFPNMTLELSDRTRVLQAALQLPTFTIEQLSELTGVKTTAVQVIVARSKDMIEEVAGLNKQVPRPLRYRLRESARARVAREGAELAERLRGPQRIPAPDTARGAAIAMDAVDSSIELGARGGEGAGNWDRRAREQLDLARRLLVLVKDPLHRTPLQRRLVQLASRLEGTEPRTGEEMEQFGPPPSAPIEPTPPIGRATLAAKGPRTIWKYPNRRLYDALERRYITLVDIHQLVLAQAEFVVIEKRGRADITRSILLQIVAEREQGTGRPQPLPDPLLSRDFLSEMIRSCDGAPRGMIGTYLDQSLNVFAAGQKNELGERGAGGGGGSPSPGDVTTP